MERPKLTFKQDFQIKCIMSHGVKADLPLGNPHHYIAFDPGEGTGWATFGENGKPTNYGNVYKDATGIYKFLHGNGPVDFSTGLPKVVIYEQFRNRKEFYGKTNLTSQTIGVIRGWAKFHEMELLSQETQLNEGNQRESGLRPEGPHSTQHWVMAFNHGWHYLTKKEIVIPRILWPEGVG